ncbi:MAG: glycosyl transferase family 2 [Alphaproteobacteria bacterium]|nr:MAG: glycosyl transferase family 2 [Alphaproteobacteria bacterium]
MLTIIVPMAGRGSRFAREGWPVPKPLIPVMGRPMIQLVIENLRPSRPHRFVFICQREHVVEYDLLRRLQSWSPGCGIVEVDGITDGAACTVLLARDYITSEPLMIANSDQYVDIAIDDYLEATSKFDGMIMTMTASDPKWSFVSLQGDQVTRVVEKQAISTEATVGIYNFSRGSEFVRAAEQMIDADQRVNNEFYVAPVYNNLIVDGARVGIYNIGAEADGMYGLGTPSDLELFLALPIAGRVVKA